MNKARRTVTQVAKEEALKEIFNDLLDIAHLDALAMITIVEDREFWVAQRVKGRQGAIGGVDVYLLK